MRSSVGVRRRCGAGLAVHPAGIAIAIVLFLPDRHAMLDLVDDEAAGIEGFATMRGAHPDPDRHVGKREASDAVDAEGMSQGKARGGCGDNSLPFLDREGLERLVLER